MATPQYSLKSPTIKRILREASELSASPSPDYHAAPLPSNIFEWHFTLRGPPSSPFSTGIYHGRIILPASYPHRPPSFRFLTPSGRFEVNREICLSISGHHEESWQPAWGVRTAVVALRAFMETEVGGQLGGLETSSSERERMAGLSKGWSCSSCGKSNGEILSECAAEAALLEGDAAKEEVPEGLLIATREEMDAKKAREKETSSSSSSSSSPEREIAEGSDDAHLAEGFVRTSEEDRSNSIEELPLPLGMVRNPDGTIIERHPYMDDMEKDLEFQRLKAEREKAAKPGQGVPKPTGVQAPAAQVPVRQNGGAQAPPRTQQVTIDSIPAWIDQLIVGLGIGFVLMVLKIVMGY